MPNHFVAFVVLTGLGLLVGLVALCSLWNQRSNSQWPPMPDAEELERREYHTMLRHRRRAKIEREWAAQKALLCQSQRK